MVDFVYPTSAQLTQIAQELAPRLASNREIFNILPMKDVDAHILDWEQRDNYIGLQQVRGLNGPPMRVKPVGGKRYLMAPGVYGEFDLLDEQQITTRRQYGTFGQPINITDMVRESQDKLLQRRLDRIEQIGWSLLTTGTFSVAQGGAVLHTDTFTLQSFTTSTAWSTPGSSTPLADFRAVGLKGRGYGVNFGTGARAYMNQTTWNRMMANTNAADLGGRRLAGLQPVNGPDALNQIMMADGLPKVVIYDDGYYDDTNTFQLFIPVDVVVVIGARRDGDPIGEYRMTRNANNPGLEPGAYMKVVDDPNRVPRSIEVHDGHNGGPVLFHPASIVLMDLTP